MHTVSSNDVYDTWVMFESMSWVSLYILWIHTMSLMISETHNIMSHVRVTHTHNIWVLWDSCHSFSAESQGAECQVWDRHGYWEGKKRKETEKKHRVHDRKRRRRALQFYQRALFTHTHMFVYICMYVDIYVYIYTVYTYMYTCVYTRRGPTYPQHTGSQPCHRAMGLEPSWCLRFILHCIVSTCSNR